MKFIDGFRAQYYLQKLLLAKKEIESQLSKLQKIWPKIEICSISEDICEQLSRQIDQVILPIIVYEIVLAGKLPGKTAGMRYQSFFLQNQNWTQRARSIPSRYPFLFQMIEIMIKSSLNNIKNILERIREDYLELKNSILSLDNSPLIGLNFGISDRHVNGQQTAILYFSSRRRLIYKPVDLRSNFLLAKFIDLVGFEKPFDLLVPKILPKEGYGWIEFIYPWPCKNDTEVRGYYKRAGVLLAVADALNYCDGHMENLIASSGYPVLIDTETLFQAFGEVDPDLGERSVLFTGLIEKPPNNETEKGFTAAFQAPSPSRYELLFPYAVNDHTDEIAVHYRGFASLQSSNSPVLKNVIQTPSGFIEDFVNGFSFGYGCISKKVKNWLEEEDWWEGLNKVKVRQLIRHTLYYELLIRKIQQPRGCISAKAAYDIVYDLLYSKSQDLRVVANYEAKEILKLDVPFFYHFPGLPHLYDGNGRCYLNYFNRSAFDEIFDRTKKRSEKYARRNIEIIKNVLPGSPKSIAL